MEHLPQNDVRIRLFSPSSPADPDRLEAGLLIVRQEAHGISPDALAVGPTAPPFAYLAGNDEEQAKIFTAALLAPGCDVLWAVRGGYGALRWIDRIAWPGPPHHAATLLGFSDVTFLHSALVSRGFPSIHGPMIATLSHTAPPSRERLWTCLQRGLFPTLEGRSLESGTAQGRLIGGNLSCLVHSLGTAFEPPWDGAILLLEDHNESLYRLDRMLTHLRVSGRLAQVCGLALGSFSSQAEVSHQDLVRLFQDRLGGLRIPIVYELPIGHGSHNDPVLLGEAYSLDGARGELRPLFRQRN